MGIATLPLAFLAGLLSILSPCVLPLTPMVLGAAVAEHRLGPVALAAGLATSFTAIGLFVAGIGYSIGLDGDVFRMIGAVMLAGFGILLMLPKWQEQLAAAAGPLGNWSQQRFGGRPTNGLRGQFGVGLLLGTVWGPCVGPTLGAATMLAAHGSDMAWVALTMLMFGLGSALPFLILGTLTREALLRCRNRLMSAGKEGKMLLGAVLTAAGLLILFGLDKKFETWVMAFAPRFLVDLSSMY
jgi:cytochrome c biogenesis protein CcdA